MTLTSAIIAAVALLALYATVVEPLTLKKTYIELKFDNLPVERLKIVQISDLHYTRMSRPLEKALEVISEENPNIVAITGDFISSDLKIRFKEFLTKLTSINRNTFAVLGNWDHNLYDTKPLKDEIINSGVTLLLNDSFRLDNGVVIAGTDDPYYGYDDLESTFRGIEESSFVIMLSHTPDIIYRAAEYKPDLVLAGHLHGGQVRIPFLKFALYVPSEYGSRFLEGLYDVQGVKMYVSRGIGTSHLRIRFFAPPEITVINLLKK